MTYNKFALSFDATRRTGSYRIIKETSIKNEVHYEVQFEMMGVEKGTFWEPAMKEHHEAIGHPYKTIMHFDTEEDALMYANRGMKKREIVKEGMIEYGL
jgi:hypothetical protein